MDNDKKIELSKLYLSKDDYFLCGEISQTLGDVAVEVYSQKELDIIITKLNEEIKQGKIEALFDFINKRTDSESI